MKELGNDCSCSGRDTQPPRVIIQREHNKVFQSIQLPTPRAWSLLLAFLIRVSHQPASGKPACDCETLAMCSRRSPLLGALARAPPCVFAARVDGDDAAAADTTDREAATTDADLVLPPLPPPLKTRNLEFCCGATTILTCVVIAAGVAPAVVRS